MKTSNSCFSQCLYFASNALARKIEKMASEHWKQVNLSPSHAYMLLMVLETPGLQPTVLSEHLQLQPSTISRLLEKLEEKKLLIRTVTGKVTNVYPTPKAKELHPQMKEIVNDFTNASVAIIGDKGSVQLLDSMTKMADRLSD